MSSGSELSVECSIPLAAALVSGSVASLAVDLVLYPLDSIKTRMQADLARRPSATTVAQQGPLRRLFTPLRYIDRTLYHGVSIACLGSVPAGGVFFATYEGVGAWLGTNSSLSHGQSASKKANLLATYPALGHMLSSCAGEAAACLVRVPTEMMKQRHQIHASDACQGLGKFGRAIARSRAVWGDITKEAAHLAVLPATTGVCEVSPQQHKPKLRHFLKVLYRGYPITLLREIPFSAAQMPLYEAAKAALAKYFEPYRRVVYYGSTRDPVDPSGWWQYYLLAPLPGVLGGAVSAYITTPMDVIKTMVMTQNYATAAHHPPAASPAGGPATSLTVIRTATAHIFKSKGLTGLFRGGGTRALWIGAGGGIFFATYETAKGQLLRAGW